jgi:anti-sigma regulatory factor (Ser/Thr protein kinase)
MESTAEATGPRGSTRATVRMLPTPSAPARARSFLHRCLRSWRAADGPDVDGDAAALVVDELVTNAVLHAGTPLDLLVDLREQALVVAVADGSSSMPGARVAAADAESGRGLALVAAIAHRWGVRPRQEGGKVVWVELQGPVPVHVVGR